MRYSVYTRLRHTAATFMLLTGESGKGDQCLSRNKHQPCSPFPTQQSEESVIKEKSNCVISLLQNLSWLPVTFRNILNSQYELPGPVWSGPCKPLQPACPVRSSSATRVFWLLVEHSNWAPSSGPWHLLSFCLGSYSARFSHGTVFHLILISLLNYHRREASLTAVLKMAPPPSLPSTLPCTLFSSIELFTTWFIYIYIF